MDATSKIRIVLITKNFLSQKQCNKRVRILRENYSILKKAEKQYKIPAEIIISIIGIESKYGSRTGSFKTFDTLASLSLGPYKGEKS